MGFSTLIPYEERHLFIKGVPFVRKTRLLPRYVFFDAPSCTEPPWTTIKQLPHVCKILQYSDDIRALQKEDLAFVEWLKCYNGLLQISLVARIGTKIQVISGPLKDYEGRIVEVKKSRLCVAVNISDTGHFRKVWCPIEYVEKI